VADTSLSVAPPVLVGFLGNLRDLPWLLVLVDTDEDEVSRRNMPWLVGRQE
jgi:hypothetical protein